MFFLSIFLGGRGGGGFFGFVTWMTIGFDMSIVIDSGLWIGHKDTAEDVLQSAGTAIMLSTSTTFHWL